MSKPIIHKQYCFAGQPAPCTGYFKHDTLPCVCGATGNPLFAISLVAIPAIPLVQTTAHIHLLPMSA
jgi:hypothetical protein